MTGPEIGAGRAEQPLHIYVDADAFPGGVKDILFRAANRERVPLTMVANQRLRVEPSPWITSIVVPAGPDVADDRIVELVNAGDLVITADIPLADRVIARGAVVISPRGERLTADNITERRAMRDLLDELRSGGLVTGGPAAFSKKDRQSFADELNSFLCGNRRG